jgi:hypothetical protein
MQRWQTHSVCRLSCESCALHMTCSRRGMLRGSSGVQCRCDAQLLKRCWTCAVFVPITSVK